MAGLASASIAENGEYNGIGTAILAAKKGPATTGSIDINTLTFYTDGVVKLSLSPKGST